MPETIIPGNDAYQRRNGLEADLADLTERVRRLEAARPPQNDPLLTQEQAASTLGLKPPTLAMWRHKKKGPAYVKIGRSAFYRQSALTAWLNEQAVIPIPKG
jgi:predicted DNA-binding transcriptional regulator AlpA